MCGCGEHGVVIASLWVLKPSPLRVSLPLFAGSLLMFFFFFYFVLPRLWGSAVSEFTTFPLEFKSGCQGLTGGWYHNECGELQCRRKSTDKDRRVNLGLHLRSIRAW